jgi:acetyltransferase-like isoleucine patch superfamily enzyme
MIRTIMNAIEYRWAISDSNRFTCWLRKKGCKVGDGVEWHSVSTIFVDTTRPSLIEIGNNVCITRGCIILTHGYDWFVLRNMYNEILCSSGRVIIGNNVFLGMGAIILKGVKIGSNCIIGAHSVVTKDIPSNSVVAGNPARVVCSIEDYYNKRKIEYIEEAKAYARSIKERYGRTPVPADFREEFPLFLKPGQQIDGILIQKQLGQAYEMYSKKHKPIFDSFQAFLRDSGVES